MSSKSAVDGRWTLAIVGSLALVPSLISLILGILVFAYVKTPSMGFFYLSIILVLACCFAIAAIHLAMVVTALILAIIGVIVGIVASIIDLVYFAVTVEPLQACMSDDMNFYGNSSYFTDAASCAAIYNVGHYDCYCAAKYLGRVFCHEFNIDSESDCGVILGSYRSSLLGYIVITPIATAAVFALFLVACIAVCCPSCFFNCDRRAMDVPGPPPNQGAGYVMVTIPPETYPSSPPVYAAVEKTEL